ncbi:MAG: hypothetical protein JO349_06660 [Candidatus Eremiobacteraeota bacterium]|nr:hypothetical protein [Candidatus Eremiobacteraeota bacterium]
MRASPWTIVCLIGFLMYAAVGYVHAGGGPRANAYYAVAGILLALSIVGLVRSTRRAKPPLH